MKSKAAHIATYKDEMTAELARSQLEASGIDARIASDDLGGMRPDLQLTRGVRLFVDSELATEAQELLAAFEVGAGLEEANRPEANGEDLIWRQELAMQRKKGKTIGRIILVAFAALFFALAKMAEDAGSKIICAAAGTLMFLFIWLTFLGSRSQRLKSRWTGH